MLPQQTSNLLLRRRQQRRPAPQPPPPTSLEEIFRLWGLDPALLRYLCRNLRIDDLYPWQARCLALPGVAEGIQDLLYSAPTSGGKTMVAELLLLLRVVGLPQQQRIPMETETGQEQGGVAESGMAAALQQRGNKGTISPKYQVPLVPGT